MIGFLFKYLELYKSYSSEADPSVTKRRVEMPRFLFDFIHVVLFQKFLKFLISAFPFNDGIASAVHTGGVLGNHTNGVSTALAFGFGLVKSGGLVALRFKVLQSFLVEFELLTKCKVGVFDGAISPQKGHSGQRCQAVHVPNQDEDQSED